VVRANSLLSPCNLSPSQLVFTIEMINQFLEGQIYNLLMTFDLNVDRNNNEVRLSFGDLRVMSNV
jgi:hypothetical protein